MQTQSAELAEGLISTFTPAWFGKDDNFSMKGVANYTAMPYIWLMKFFEFIELAPFADVRDELFDEDAFLEFQWHLCANPEEGAVIPGSGGCRKIRWKTKVKENVEERGLSTSFRFLPTRLYWWPDIPKMSRKTSHGNGSAK